MQNEEEKKEEVCPTCGGNGYVYQIDAALEGGVFQTPPERTFSQRVKCPRCGGSGLITKAIAAIITGIIIYILA